ncbi:unnamed protein product [Natator depressus]
MLDLYTVWIYVLQSGGSSRMQACELIEDLRLKSKKRGKQKKMEEEGLKGDQDTRATMARLLLWLLLSLWCMRKDASSVPHAGFNWIHYTAAPILFQTVT